MRRWFCLALFLASCSEYDVTSVSEVVGVFNPQVIPPSTETDVLVQRTTPQVDVLWVLDNSSSMQAEASLVAQNFPKFIDYFIGSGLDWHVGIISTNLELDDHSGKLQSARGVTFLDPDTPYPAEVFAEMVPYYPGVSHQESGRAAIYMAVENHQDGHNLGFLRERANLHVVVISDEDDHSEHPSLPEFIHWLEGLKSENEILTFSAITGVQLCANTSEIGADYIAVNQAIGGILWSICADDWAPVLEALGEQAAGMSKEFFLSQLPLVETIEVQVVEDGVTYLFEEGVDWEYELTRNSIVFFEFVPSALSEVRITYDVASG